MSGRTSGCPAGRVDSRNSAGPLAIAVLRASGRSPRRVRNGIGTVSAFAAGMNNRFGLMALALFTIASTACRPEEAPVCSPACSSTQVCVSGSNEDDPGQCAALPTPATNAPGAAAPANTPLPSVPMAPPTGTPTTPNAPGSTAGNLRCDEIYACIVRCPNTDANCPNGCVARGTADGQQQLGNVLQCLQSTGCQGDACQQMCAMPIAACFGQTPAGGTSGNAPSGGRGCYALVECFDPCQDQACIQACVESHSDRAVTLLNALYACADRTGCNEQTCLQACSAEYDACRNDR